MRYLFILFSVMLIFTTANAGEPAKYETAIFAGGCFWCTESDFDQVPGVTETISGYIGGQLKNPSYKQVSAGNTGHTEAVKISYDPSKVSYEKLLDVYWHSIDPTKDNSQFCDYGSQYRPEIFYLSDEQKKIAGQSKISLQQNKPFPQSIKVNITKASVFYPAEDYHQNYHMKNPVRYKYYRYRCGRDERLEELWGS